MADINSQILEALNQGVGPQDIIDHLSKSENPEHRAWVANYKTNLVSDSQPSSVATSTPPAAPNVSGVQALGGVANKMAQSYADLPTSAQLAIPAAVAAGSYVGAKAVNLGFKTLEEKLKANQEIKTQAALNALEPSAAVKVQQQQLALQQAEQANRFAQQAAGVNAGPVSDPLLDARVQTETQRTASEAARTKIAEAQAQLAQEKLIQTQRKAAMVKANPAGAAAQVAAAEGLPIDAQITTGAQPSAAQLAETHGINLPTAQGSVTPPTNVEPIPVSPANATPAVPETPTTTAEVVTNPNATPVEKAVTLTQEAPPAVETPKVAGAAEPQVLKTGTGKPAFAGEGPATTKFKSSYPDVKSVPQGYAFVPGAQAINTLRNNIGQETFTEHYSKNPYPADYKEALQQGQDINKSLGRMTREELKVAGIAPPNVVPGIGAQVGGVKGSRLIKVGGVAGMLIAMSDLAKAKDLATAGFMGADIATDFIPGVATAKMALTGTGLNAGDDETLAYARRRQAAKELGAGNRGKAFDPRIPYNSALANIGIPPPYSR